MEGEQFHIALTYDAKPFCVDTPRTIPYAYREKLLAELQSLEDHRVITPVSYPTEWCAPIVVTPKKGTDDIRMCVDHSHLNRFIKCERYQSATPSQAVADITAENAQIFTKLDTRKGYHQCPLDNESQDLPCLSPHLDGSSSSSFVHPTESHRYPNITNVGWMRHLQASQVSDA